MLPRAELLGGPAAALGLGLLLGYGHATPALTIGFSTLAGAFVLRAFRPPAKAAPEPAPTYAPVPPPATPPGYLALVAGQIQGLASATALVGVPFRLLRWPGAGAMLLVGVMTLGPIVAYQAAAGRLAWRPAPALALGLVAGLGFAPLMRLPYRDDPTLAGKVIYQQAHPRDAAARAEVQQRLRTRQ